MPTHKVTGIAMKVLITDAIAAEALALLQARTDIQVEVKTELTAAALKAQIGAYHGVIIRTATCLDGAIIEQARRLKVIGRVGVGLDNIDLEAAQARGLVIVNAVGANTSSVVEHTMGLLLALARRIPQGTAALRAGRWDKERLCGVEIHGKTLGIIGLGRIGRGVAKVAQAFGMRVIACDPYVPDSRFTALGVTRRDLGTLLAESDFVSLHTPLTKETRRLIDARALARMKPTAMLINCARGDIIDEQALFQTLRAGSIGGAALDVFEQEPAGNNPLFDLEQVIATPHLGGATHEARRRAALVVVEKVLQVLLRN